MDRSQPLAQRCPVRRSVVGGHLLPARQRWPLDVVRHPRPGIRPGGFERTVHAWAFPLTSTTKPTLTAAATAIAGQEHDSAASVASAALTLSPTSTVATAATSATVTVATPTDALATPTRSASTVAAATNDAATPSGASHSCARRRTRATHDSASTTLGAAFAATAATSAATAAAATNATRRLLSAATLATHDTTLILPILTAVEQHHRILHCAS